MISNKANDMRYVIALILSIYSLPSFSALKLDGFVNVGASVTDSAYAGIRTQVSQDHALFENEIDWRQISSLGLQIEWELSNELQLVSQLVAKDNARNKLSEKLKFAFLRYQPSPEWTLNLGRTAFDLYMRTDYRDIGFAYTPVHLPTEFYGIIPHESLDGLDLTYKRMSNVGLLSAKAFYGASKAPVISDNDFLWDVNLKQIKGLTLQVEQPDWLVRFNFTETTAKDGYPGQEELLAGLRQVPDYIWPSVMNIKESLQFENSDLTYIALGLRYDDAIHVFQSEISRVDSKSILLNELMSGYVSYGQRFGNHTLMLTWAHIEADSPNIERPLVETPQLMQLYEAVKLATDFYRLRQTTNSISWRYEMSETWALKTQIDFTDVRYQPSGLYLHNTNEPEDGHFSTLSISSHWIFDL